jgi:serine/threonine protein kinase
MRKLIHPHIASVLFWLKGPGSCSIFMEPSADYNLRGYLDKCCEDGHPPNTLETITPWFGCLLHALAFAHARKITHRDIKPANILVKNGQVFLADFGEAKDFSQLAMSMTSNYMMCGTPVYRAPEVTPGNPRGLPADVFSLGCVFSEMLTVCSGRSLTDYQEWRKAPELEFPFMFRANLKKVREWINKLESSEELIDPLSYLIKLMLKEDPKTRSSAQQLWSWLVNVNSGIKLYCDYH